MTCKKCKKQIPDDSAFCCYCGNRTEPERRKRKNTNGFGSVVFLGKNRSRPYAVRKTISYNDKHQKRMYVGYYATRAEAMKALGAEQVNPTPELHKITFSQLFEKWKTTRAYTDISKSTKDCYNAAYNHYSDIYNTEFLALRADNFQRCIDSAISSSNKPLSASGKRQMKILAGLLYKYALENDIAQRNYAEFIRLDKELKKDKEIFTKDEISLIESNDTLPGADIVLILIYTGMRINELLNLKVTDVDFNNNIITGDLKTEAGKNRVIPIHKKIRKYLINRCSNSSTYVFLLENGSRMSDNYFRSKLYKPLLNTLKIEYKTIHSTRHTCATLLTECGANTEAITRILGHSNYAFTADTYTHVDIDFLKENIEKI